MEISQDLFERLVDIRRTSNRFMVTSGIEITDAGEGTATTRLVTNAEQHQNP